jgi:post-segregation antitoxin (ccd killing protein)
MPPPSSDTKTQQPQQKVLLMLTPTVPMPLLHQALLLLKRSRCLNISAFCREAIAEKLERLEAVK